MSAIHFSVIIIVSVVLYQTLALKCYDCSGNEKVLFQSCFSPQDGITHQFEYCTYCQFSYSDTNYNMTSVVRRCLMGKPDSNIHLGVNQNAHFKDFTDYICNDTDYCNGEIHCGPNDKMCPKPKSSSPSLAGHPWLLAGSVFVSLMLVKKME